METPQKTEHSGKAVRFIQGRYYGQIGEIVGIITHFNFGGKIANLKHPLYVVNVRGEYYKSFSDEFQFIGQR